MQDAEQGSTGANPYSTSATTLEDAAIASGPFIPGGRVVDAGRGTSWLGEAFDLFKKNPGIWIANVIILFVILCVLAMVPFLGSLAMYLLLPVFSGGMMLGCHSLANGGELEIEHLFAGFKQNTAKLVLVGVFYLIGMVVIMVVIGALSFAIIGGASLTGMLAGGAGGAGMMSAMMMGGFGIGLLLILLISLALSIPLMMAIWFAPVLVILQNLEPLDAMKMSFHACLKNFVPFLVYGVVYFVLAIVATIPFGLGWLVLGPMVIASAYTSYRDIFTQA
ncbi:MAG: hypothetical protein JO142_14880 [Burkholderiales bacterium]|nr:hypothetical protein [Burkholderiales bacterium]